MTLKAFPTLRAPLSALGALAMAASAAAIVPASAQTAPTTADGFTLPPSATAPAQANPNSRSATAVVNGYVITGTDISQRVALITNASQVEVSPEELERLRAQVLRNLIDETLKIQAAEAQEIGVTADRKSVV